MGNKPFRIPEDRIKEIDFHLIYCGVISDENLEEEESQEYQEWAEEHERKMRR